jgi:hypothetical protein
MIVQLFYGIGVLGVKQATLGLKNIGGYRSVSFSPDGKK